MNRTGVTLSLLGLLAASAIGCQTAPPSGEAPASSDAPLVELPREAREADLFAPSRLASEADMQLWNWHGGRRYRFRRILVGNVPYYVPYAHPSTSAHYVPYYSAYDPSYYYVPAYAAPVLGARSITVRYGRQSR